MSECAWASGLAGCLGALSMRLDGTVYESIGQLKDETATAETIFQMLHDAQRVVGGDGVDPFRRLTVSCNSFVFAVTLDNEMIYVVKRKE